MLNLVRLRLILRLVLRYPVSEAAELSFDFFEASKTYVLKEHRKMKRAEVHFLDHPMMGLIIQITKYEVPVNAESDEGS